MQLLPVGYSWLLANTSPDPKDFVSRFLTDGSLKQAENSAQAFDQLWRILVLQQPENGAQFPNGVGIYTILTTVGLYLAVGTLMIFMVQWAKQMLHSEGDRPLTDLMWPLMVAILLSNQGTVLAQATLGVRNVINLVNHSVLFTLNQTLQIESTLAGITNYRLLQDEMATIISQCDPFVHNHEKLKSCRQAALQDFEPLKDEYARNPHRFLKDRGLAELSQRQEEIQHSLKPVVSAIPRNQGLALVSDNLISLGVAFQHTIEACMLLTGIVGPVAVGASLLPFGNKPVFGWLSSFVGLGIAKCSYNLLNAVVVVSVYYIGTKQNFLYQDFSMGVLNPLLAFGLASGGGKALFNNLMSTNESLRTRVLGGVSEQAIRKIR